MKSFSYKTTKGLNLVSNYPWTGWGSIEKKFHDKEAITIEVINDPFLDLRGWNKIDVLENGKRIIWEDQSAGILTAINSDKLELRYKGVFDRKYESWVMGWGISTILFQRGFLVIPGCQVKTINGPILCLGREYPGFLASEKHEIVSPLFDEFISLKFDPNQGFSVYDIPGHSHPEENDKCFPDIGNSKTLSEFESFKKLFEAGPVNVKHLSENLVVMHFKNIERFLNLRKIHEIDIDGKKIFFAFLNADPMGLV